VTQSYKFWEMVAALGNTDEVFRKNAFSEVDQEQVKKWIQSLADHRGHKLYMTDIKMPRNCKRTTASVCVKCNRHNIGGNRWFYARCDGKLASDSVCFWKAVQRHGSLKKVLADMPQQIRMHVTELLSVKDE